jgi:hypothetical protein
MSPVSQVNSLGPNEPGNAVQVAVEERRADRFDQRRETWPRDARHRGSGSDDTRAFIGRLDRVEPPATRPACTGRPQ